MHAKCGKARCIPKEELLFYLRDVLLRPIKRRGELIARGQIWDHGGCTTRILNGLE